MSPSKMKSALIVAAVIILAANPSYSVERLSVRPGGVVLEGARSYRGAVMSAYQKAYAMNFDVYQPAGLPAGWYATFDGFPVTQVSPNRWVYGQVGYDGAIIPTDILVGSVIPQNVPGLARAAFTGNYGAQVNSEAFRKILNYDVNRMGVLSDNALRTIIAWLGDRWKRFSPGAGEYAWQV